MQTENITVTRSRSFFSHYSYFFVFCYFFIIVIGLYVSWLCYVM